MIVLFCIVNGWFGLEDEIEKENVCICVLVLFGLMMCICVIRDLFFIFFLILLLESVICVGVLLMFRIRIKKVFFIDRFFGLW